MPSGSYIRTDEIKRKQSTSMKNKNPWNKNIKHDFETRQKISESLQKENNPNYGNKYTGKRLQQMISSGNKGRFKHHKINKSFGIKKIYYEMIYFIKTKLRKW